VGGGNQFEQHSIRVLHVTHNMAVGGTEQVITQLIKASYRRQVQHTIACIDGVVGVLGKALAAEGIDVKPIARQPGFDRNVIRELRALIKSASIDVIHCHQYTPYSYGVLAAFGTKARVIFTEHGRFYPDRYSWKRRIVNPFLSLITQHIVAISQATREALAHYEWIPKRRIDVIYNGVHVPAHDAALGEVRGHLGISDEHIVFGTLARLDSIKNQSLMIRALAELSKSHPKCLLILAGDGPERSALEREVEELGLQQVVIFTGFVAEIENYLMAMDVFLLTSFSEGTSMTLLEAMALGRAVMATRVGGNEEVIGPAAGKLIDSDNLPALVQAMGDLAQDDAVRQQLGEVASQRYQECFDPQQMTERYLALYQGGH